MNAPSKYVHMRDAGRSPGEVCRAAAEDGLSSIAQMKLVRELYGLSVIDAKAVMIMTSHGQTLEEYQAELFEDLCETLERLDEIVDESQEP